MSSNPFGSRALSHSGRRQSAGRTWQPIGATAAASIDQFGLFEPERLCYSSPVGWVGARAVVDMPLLDVLPRVAHRPCRIFEQQPLLLRGHLPEQISGLLPMVVVDAVVPMRRVALDRHWRLGKIRLVVPQPRAVGMEGKGPPQIAVGAHLAVAMVALKRAFGRVDRNMVEVDADPVTLGVAVGEQASLKHLVGRKADAGHDVG